MGHIYFIQKDFEKAISCFKNAIEFSSSNIQIAKYNFSLGYLYQTIGEFKNAEISFLNALKLFNSSFKKPESYNCDKDGKTFTKRTNLVNNKR